MAAGEGGEGPVHGGEVHFISSDDYLLMMLLLFVLCKVLLCASCFMCVGI